MSIYTNTGTIKSQYIEVPLDQLNLSWKERDLPQPLRTKHVHGLHPYFGKFIPQLVEIFIRRYFSPGDVILDPFCGSGTTLIESNSYGINSVGIDVSPFNCLISRSKTLRYNISALKNELYDIYNKTEDIVGPETLFSINSPINEVETESDYLNTWYTPRSKLDLFTYKSLIPSYRYQDIIKLVLTRAARSARNIKHYELDHPKAPVAGPYYCQKHDRTCYPVDGALKFLRRYTENAIKRISEFSNIRTDASVKIIQGDSRNVSIRKKFNGIITSPPYVGNINYHEQHIYAYELLDIPRFDELEIGPMSKGRTKAAIKNYKEDIASSFLNCSRFLKKGSIVIIVANDSQNLYPSIIENSGLKLIATLEREVDRRTGRRGNKYSEYIFVTKY